MRLIERKCEKREARRKYSFESRLIRICFVCSSSEVLCQPVQGIWKLSANRAQTVIGAIEQLCRGDDEKLVPVGPDLAGDPEQLVEEGQSRP